MSLLDYNWESVLLLVFTHFLVVTDRAFSKKVRREFQIALLSCFFLIALDQHFVFNQVGDVEWFVELSQCIEIFMRPLVLCLLAYVTIPRNGKTDKLIFLPMLVELVCVIFGLDLICYVISAGYAAYLLYVLIKRNSRRELADIIFAVFLGLMIIFALSAEIVLSNSTIVNSCLTVVTCIYYYYFVMRTYKKDRLTGLLIRHNLNYEMEDNLNRAYDMVLIDVDNFKLINDKYGHDKGDEALITIVKTTLKHLPRGCRMYRFGGDEFVILSVKVSTEKLVQALVDTNDELAASDLRMSYGVVRHEPGVESIVSLTAADKAMYENKRQIKSEDIWDDMTGLYNLRGFLDELDTFRRAVGRDGHIVCLIGVDVERLSNINKAYGYSEGNLIITVLAKSMKSCLHGRDFIGHLGSDEFVAAVECEGPDDSVITSYISQLQELVDTSYEMASKDYSIKLNIDRYYINMDDLEASSAYVDELLYIKQEDKDNRRKNDLTEADKDYSDKEDAVVQDILDNNRLQYAFQPIVSSKDGSIVAYESLMRAEAETMMTPLKILKYAERSKRSYDVERYTMFNTLEKFSTCSNIPEGAKIFVNSIPGHQLNDVDFDLLKSRYSHLFDRLVVEVTEQRDISDDSLVILNTRRDKNGFSLAIDDYGSGVSNTNNLLRYMPQIVKLDRLLITGIDRNAKKQFFVNSIISFAKENDMLTLAEGVETESELKTVIRLGVDMIQGYITSKPSLDVITEIPEDIKRIIVNENLRVRSNPRMTYTAGEVCELSVVQLAMEDYTKINVSAPSLTITGSSEYTADITIKIKDNLDCHMTLSDVRLHAVDDRPCIELGENTNLTLNIEGTNRLNATGIYVPDSSSLTIIGGGKLEIYVKGQECFAIGSSSLSSFGKITLKSSGLIVLNVDGEECVGIGGGIAGKRSAINMLSGTVNLTMAGVHAIGIGTFKGNVPIRTLDTAFNIVFRVSSGAVVGTLDGEQDIEIKNFICDITGSGRDIAVLGCTGEVRGSIVLNSGSFIGKFSGHNVYYVGGSSGDVLIDISHCSLDLLGEGDNIVGFGTVSREARLRIKECSVKLVINASSPTEIGAAEKEVMYIGPDKAFIINGVTSDIYQY